MTADVNEATRPDSASDGPAHPLDPLSAAEIARAADLVRAHPVCTETTRFASIMLAEPSKPEMAAYDAAGLMPERVAFVVLYDGGDTTIREVVASLSAGTVRSVTGRPGERPGSAWPEFKRAQDAIKADPGWQAALARRGITDLENVEVHAWPPGYNDDLDDVPGHRIAKGMTYLGLGPKDNVYARPVEGLVVTVDMDTAEVLRMEDDEPGGEVVPVSADRGDFGPETYPPRDTVRTIEILQPDGPSFSLDGNLLRWQNWSVRVGFNSREGIVLHQLSYSDAGRERSVIYRAALSEMWVPYGDPAPLHRVKAVFDEGEAGGLGAHSNSLMLGCDCLGEIRYLDGTIADHEGQPVTIRNAICVHEEDTGIVWKHTRRDGPDPNHAQVEVRRGRRLVISSFSTVGNYDYGFFWYLNNDGGISYEVKLTGIIAAGGVKPGETPAYGTIVAPGVYGPHHQHIFNVRLDMAVDGTANSVIETDSVLAPPGPGNPVGNAWVAKSTVLADEAGAQRNADSSVARTWTIVNENVTNHVGQPVGYQLIPGSGTPSMLPPDSPAGGRAGFAARHLWVTPYRPGERYAAGDYPYQSAAGTGLPAYTAGNEPVRNTDIVIWHSFVAHHVVRPEDWPVMPVTTAGMHLRPSGFFDRNPALDLPRPESADHCHHH
ncbi:MAG TPA: primary-amine oxidase [Trebonia sp.]